MCSKGLYRILNFYKGVLKIEENGNIYILMNYALRDIKNVELLKSTFPKLIFKQVASYIYTVQVPKESEQEFVRLQQVINFILEPTPFGLNVTNALEVSNISIFHNYPYGELRGRGVLIGFVDTGIDYTNTLFQNADGTTRIISIWDQTIQGNPPETYGYGSIYSQRDINAALQAEDPFSIVPSRDEIGHGTFLAGIAAGNDQTNIDGFAGGAPDSSIVMVKLRQVSARIRDYHMINKEVPAYQDTDILTGINYLLEVAYDLNRPIVICIGMGSNYGSHNGTEILEIFLQELSIAPNVITVIAAGNEANSGHHYRGEVALGMSEVVEINVGENESGFIMFMMTASVNRLRISIRSPLGQVIESIPILSQQDQTYSFNLERTIATVTYRYPSFLSGDEQIVIRLQNPTPGIWSLVILGEIIVDGVFHIWLPRRDFIENTTRFLRPDPNTTVQIPGTQRFSLIVGAYDYIDDSVYIASGRGPTPNGVIKPNIIAPGVNIQGPSPGGGFTTYTGTSAAAAITASACALLLQWAVVDKNSPYMNTVIATGILVKGARRQKNVMYPNNLEGYGRLDLQSSIADI